MCSIEINVINLSSIQSLVAAQVLTRSSDKFSQYRFLLCAICIIQLLQPIIEFLRHVLFGLLHIRSEITKFEFLPSLEFIFNLEQTVGHFIKLYYSFDGCKADINRAFFTGLNRSFVNIVRVSWWNFHAQRLL